MLLNLTPDWFEQFLGWHVEQLDEKIFYHKNQFNSLARIYLDSTDPHVPARAILKRTFPPAPVCERMDALDPYEFVREYYAYRELPGLGVKTAQVYYCAIEPVSEENLILMEDLTLTGYIYPAEHVWSFTEMQSILQTYAGFHTAGFQAGQGLAVQFAWLLLQQAWLKPGLFERSVSELHRSPVTAGRLRGSEATLSALLDLLEPLKKFLAGQPETFNYNDFFPGNVAIPVKPGTGHPAVLFDWHMMGAGIVQNDLLNVLWGWAEDDEPLRDQAIQFYLDCLKSQAVLQQGQEFDLAWAKDGMLIASVMDVYQTLARLAEFILQVEQSQSRLPGWMEAQLNSLESGKVDQLLVKTHQALDLWK